MKKKIAILVRDRKHEALRMAVGATLADDEVNVFVMDDEILHDDEIDVNLQMLTDLGIPIYTNNTANPYEQKSTDEIGIMLSGFDLVVPY
jgi:hypothetical protein